MGNPAIITETFGDDDQSWLASSHGTDAGDSGTLDGASFTGTFTDGLVPSGVAVALHATSGRYVAYDDADVTGEDVEDMVGHLFTAQQVIAKDGQTYDVPCSVLRHCKVREANLPTGHGLDAAGKADVAGRIDYV